MINSSFGKVDSNQFKIPRNSIFFKDFIYLFDRSQVGREAGGGGRGAGSLLSREPDGRAQSQDPEIMT